MIATASASVQLMKARVTAKQYITEALNAAVLYFDLPTEETMRIHYAKAMAFLDEAIKAAQVADDASYELDKAERAHRIALLGGGFRAAVTQ